MSSIHALAGQPPSYTEAMRDSDRNRTTGDSSSTSVDEKWTCLMCTFQNHIEMPMCEACEMPRRDISGIRITSSSFHPLLENNRLQSAPPPPTTKDNSSTNNSNVMQASAL